MTGSTPEAVTPAEVLRWRERTHCLVGPGLPNAAEVVRRLTGVQSQEYAHAAWSLAMRTDGLTMAQVQQEFAAGAFLRTHILRATWHLVAAEDLRWMQAVTAPRVQQLNGTMYRREGLDQGVLDRAANTIVAELAGGPRTRPELGRVLGAEGFRLAYLIMNAELEALICSGPMRGSAHTYSLLEDRLAGRAENQGDAAELARRFFAGHGPASVHDLARWSSLTLAQSQAALDAAADRLDFVVVDGTRLWFDPELGEGREGGATDRSERAFLMPLYDELTLSHPQLNYPQAEEHPHPPGVDRFVGSVLVDGRDVGTWRRTVKGRRLTVELALAPGVTPGQRQQIDDQVTRLARFLDLTLP